MDEHLILALGTSTEWTNALNSDRVNACTDFWGLNNKMKIKVSLASHGAT